MVRDYTTATLSPVPAVPPKKTYGVLCQPTRFRRPLFVYVWRRKKLSLSLGDLSITGPAGEKTPLSRRRPLHNPGLQARILPLPGERAGVRGSLHHFSPVPRVRQSYAKVPFRLCKGKRRTIIGEIASFPSGLSLSKGEHNYYHLLSNILNSTLRQACAELVEVLSTGRLSTNEVTASSPTTVRIDPLRAPQPI